MTAKTSASATPYPARTSASQGDGGIGAAALSLLQLQSEMRKARTLAELGYFIANETRSVLRAQQIVVFDLDRRRRPVVHTISSLTSIERASPLLQWFESIVDALLRSHQIDRVSEFEAGAFAGNHGAVERAYPLRHMLWVPWAREGSATLGGMLLARTTPWGAQDVTAATYVGEAFAHAWHALSRRRSSPRLLRSSKAWKFWGAGFVVAALLAVPVPMTALAPVEVGPRDTFIVTPGVEGVIRNVEVDPNAEVKAGQILLTLNDTVLRNRAEIADREVQIADTRYIKAAQLAFVDARGRHEMAIAKSELDLKLAERDYARELLQRTEIRAERDGVAFFADRKDLVGKPVAIGERLMEIANPASSEFRIELPAADAIVLRPSARVKVFLDSDPLNPIEAQLIRASYKAAPREAQQFAFRLVARASEEEMRRLRLGLRGTAQIYSDNVALGFYLFRRPIAVARQWSGL